jgi:hypothetical protein
MEDKPEPFERDYKEHLSMNEEALPAFERSGGGSLSKCWQSFQNLDFWFSEFGFRPVTPSGRSPSIDILYVDRYSPCRIPIGDAF